MAKKILLDSQVTLTQPWIGRLGDTKFIAVRLRAGFPALLLYTNHIKYLISSEPHWHLNSRRVDAEMVIPF